MLTNHSRSPRYQTQLRFLKFFAAVYAFPLYNAGLLPKSTSVLGRLGWWMRRLSELNSEGVEGVGVVQSGMMCLEGV